MRYFPHSSWHFTIHTHTQIWTVYRFSVTCKKKNKKNMPVKQQNSSENAASTWSLIRQATLCTTWAWGVVIWSQTCVYTQPLLYHNRLFQQSLTKWHQHSQRIHVTQNKHKATHDQLNQTASFGGVTFSASVVQLGKALVRLLFSSLFLAHENIDTHADKYTLVPHLSVTVSSVLWQKRLWGPLVFYIPVVIYNSAPLKKKKRKKIHQFFCICSREACSNGAQPSATT